MTLTMYRMEDTERVRMKIREDRRREVREKAEREEEMEKIKEERLEKNRKWREKKVDIFTNFRNNTGCQKCILIAVWIRKIVC